MDAVVFLELCLLGLAVGTFGTLVGAGGGFLLAPILLLLYPDDSPQVITSISLAVVFLNAGSGSVSYWRRRRIDYRTGLLFAAATVPGGLLGVAVNYALNRAMFDVVLGVILILSALYMVFGKQGAALPQSVARADMHIEMTDASGSTFRYAYNRKLGFAFSLCVGFLATLLGIGGGSIHVAGMVSMLGIPVHVATATSHFVLAITAFFATAAHLVTGELAHGLLRITALGLGVIVGAQLGAGLSDRVGSRLIVQMLGATLVAMGLRLLYGAL